VRDHTRLSERQDQWPVVDREKTGPRFAFELGVTRRHAPPAFMDAGAWHDELSTLLQAVHEAAPPCADTHAEVDFNPRDGPDGRTHAR
jgi:hypothetical protein